MNDYKHKFINGPMNIVRLEGKIGKINKVIYIFMDSHVHIYLQKQCNHILSEDIQKYFFNTFVSMNDSEIIYDFFFEIVPTDIVYLNSSYKDIYIEEVAKFFKNTFKFDSVENKVKFSDYFKNVRLHYLDIREYIGFHDIVDKGNNIKMLYNDILSQRYFDHDNVNNILSLFKEIKDQIEISINIFTNSNKNKIEKQKIIKEKSINKFSVDTSIYLINKMRYIYNYSFIKEIMNGLLDDNIEELKNINDKINNVMLVLNDNLNDYELTNKLTKYDELCFDSLYDYGKCRLINRIEITEIMNSIDKILHSITVIYARIMDIFFMRRFLDKDYVTNSIVYCGASHSNYYIYILLKNFNFKITNVSYSKINEMKKLTETIKNSSYREISGLLWPEIFQQCSDMINFPKNFT